MRQLAPVVGLAFLVLTAPSVGALPITNWTAPATGYWTDGPNWDAGVPTAAHDAFVEGGPAVLGRPLLFEAGVALNLLVGDTATGTVTLDSGSTLSVGEVVTLGRLGTGSVSGWGTLTAQRIVVGGWGSGLLNCAVDCGELLAATEPGSQATGHLGDHGTSGPGTVTADLMVGDGGTANLTFGHLHCGECTLGEQAGSSGTLGSGQDLSVAGLLTVGGSGTGLLGVGSALDVESCIVGRGPGSEGTIDGEPTITVGGTLVVGESGVGTVHAGGLDCQSCVIGLATGSSGWVRDDGDETYMNNSPLTIGSSGTGTLQCVSLQGVSTCILGEYDGGRGSLTLGQTLQVTGGLTVGKGGRGDLVMTMARHSSAGQLTLGDEATGVGVVDLGWTSDLSVAGPVTLGRAGSATLRLEVEGYLNCPSCVLADLPGSSADVSLSDMSGLSVAGPLTIAKGGTAHVLLTGYSGYTLGDSLLSSSSCVIGQDAGSQGELVIERAGGASGELRVTGPLTVGEWGDGEISVDSGIATTGDCSIAKQPGSNGTIVVRYVWEEDASWLTNGSLYVGGSDLGAGGTGLLEVHDQSSFSVTNTLKVWPDGTLRLVDGTTVASFFDIAGGRVEGEGTLQGAVMNAGVTSPGLSPGQLSVQGDYQQTALGRLLIEILSDTPGEFDVLSITGTASLGGTLQVLLLPGFDFEVGDTFLFLTAGSVEDTFDVEALPMVPTGGPLFSVTYGATGVTLTALFDSEAMAAIPEPATLSLLALGGLCLIRRRRRTPA